MKSTSAQAYQEAVLSGISDTLREETYEIIIHLHQTLGHAPIISEISDEYKARNPVGREHVYPNDLSKRVSELLEEGRVVPGPKRRSHRSSKLCYGWIPTHGDRKMVVESKIETLRREIKNAEALIGDKYDQLEELLDENGQSDSAQTKLTERQKVLSLTSLAKQVASVLKAAGLTEASDLVNTSLIHINGTRDN